MNSMPDFLVMGVKHIWTGYDHLLFLLGLLIVTRNFSSAVKIITCFTIAHSITLAVATLSLVSISSRVVEWSDAIRARAVANVALYKRIRGTITGADVYHLTPSPDHNNPTGWMALQYVAPAGGRSVLLAYRLAGGEASKAFPLRGLDAATRYDVSVDGVPLRQATGAELAGAGFRVDLDAEWRAAVIELVPRR